MGIMDEDVLPGEEPFVYQIRIDKTKYNDAKNWAVNEGYDTFEMIYTENAYFLFRNTKDAAHFKLVWGDSD